MTLRFHDTMAGAVVPLETREPGRVAMYVCGPTPYDVPHLGHGRTAVVFDTLRRYLEWSGLEVTFVTNVTDVEDKIIDRAQRDGTTEPELAARFEQEYWAQLDRLHVRRPDHTPHATGYIAQMIALVEQLVASGHAYVVPGRGVYFEIETYPAYGELSHRKLDDLREGAGARVEVEPGKRSPLDFALWKAAKPGEPEWDSPWGAGRPGWHIECSAMSLDLLGDDFDLHGGGEDLRFPHHENERAQAEAAGHRFARHWVHSGMLNVGGEKMSKSLGNFVTLAEAIDAHGGRALRLLMLQAHYRSPLEVSETALRAAASALDRLDALARRAAAAGVVPAAPDGATRAAFADAMDDDFNTPRALGVVFEAVSRANAALDAGDHERAADLLASVVDCTDALGLSIEAGGSGNPEIDGLVEQREAARRARDFATADRLRDELHARGVVVEDTPNGPVWHRRA